MGWNFKKSFLPTAIGAIGGFLAGGPWGAAVGAGMGAYSADQADKQEKAQKKAMQKMEEEAEKNKVTPTVVDDSVAQEEARRRNAAKRGRASTILAGDYRQSAVKRLLGE